MSPYDDLSEDKIDEIERERDVTYDYSRGRFLPNNGHHLNPDFPTHADLRDAKTEVDDYLEDNP